MRSRGPDRLSMLRNDLVAEIGRTRETLDARINAVRDELRGEIRQDAEHTRGHLDVVAERVRSRIQTVAEGVMTLAAGQERLRTDVDERFRGVHARLDRVEARVLRPTDR